LSHLLTRRTHLLGLISIAALISDTGVAKVMSVAKKHFRGLSFDALTLPDFECSKDSGLISKAQRARLG
jgi:hypothetical protein